VTRTNDPTAHAEIVGGNARPAALLGAFQLERLRRLTHRARPCPLCGLGGALLGTRPARIFFAATHEGKRPPWGFDDSLIYLEIRVPLWWNAAFRTIHVAVTNAGLGASIRGSGTGRAIRTTY